MYYPIYMANDRSFFMKSPPEYPPGLSVLVHGNPGYLIEFSRLLNDPSAFYRTQYSAFYETFQYEYIRLLVYYYNLRSLLISK